MRSSYEDPNQKYYPPESLYYRTEYKAKWFQQKLETAIKPPTFKSLPFPRSLRRKFEMKKLCRKDISWTNLHLLTMFMNPAAKLYNRFQNQVETRVHRKIVKAIKKARWLGFLPFYGTLKPSDRVNLKPFIEEIHKYDQKVIDAQSGLLTFRDVKETYSDKLKKGTRLNSFEPEDKEFVKELVLDRDVIPPSFKQAIWMKAQQVVKKVS